MSRVFIFGIAGFCGSHLCDVLKTKGHYIEGCDLAPAIDSKADHVYRKRAQDHYPGFMEQWDYIFHCAGPAGPARIKPGYALKQIIDLTAAGLDFAQRCGARFVKFSSSEVYGRSDVPLTETTPPIIHVPYDARSEYQVGFIAAEQLCMSHPHPDVQVLRLFNVVGPGQRAETGCVLPRFCQQALRGEPLTIFGGSQRRAFMYIDDLISFCLQLMDKWPTDKSIWNVANPDNEVTIIELLNRVVASSGCRLIDNGIEVMVLNEHYRDSIEKHNIDITKARSIGWSPKVTLTEIIERTLAWHREEMNVEANR